MKKRYLFLTVVLAFLVLPSLEAQTKKRLAILPFSGGQAQDGETISILLSNQRALLDVFTVQPRNSAIDRIMGEQQYQRQSGLINSDAISEIGKLNTADLVVSGYIARLGNTNLLLISIVDVTEVQQVAGVYQTYRSIEEIRGLLPNLSQRLAEASRKNYQNLPGLAIPSFDVPSNVNANDAMVLAQILATEIVNLGRYAVFPRNNSVNDVLREHQFQRDQTANAKALGTSRTIDYILSSSVMSLGRMNLFAAQILSIERGENIIGADREYQDISDGLSKNLMREIAGELIGVRVSSASTPSIQPATSTQSTSTGANTNSIISPNAGWRIGVDSTSTAKINIGREHIDGRERDVLTVEVNLARGNIKWAGAGNNNDTILQQLRAASGVRFNVLGDGKTWILYFSTRETQSDSCFHRANVSTRNGSVVEVDIPFSRLRQPDWGRKVKFNKNSITGVVIERETENGSGAATIKIFDFEIY